MSLLIGELATRTGEDVRTLRFWTDRGLLRAERGENTYRQYEPDAVERVVFIRSAQALGLKLEAIRWLLEVTDRERQPCEHVLREWTARLAEVREAIQALRMVEGTLEARLTETQVPPCHTSGCRYLPAPAGT